jgi:hypothetical protein
MPLNANEQYLLELINRARLDASGEAAIYGLGDLNRGLLAGTISDAPKQPLAPNSLLNAAAVAHSQWMLSVDQFSHTGVGGSSPGQRMEAAGYAFSGSWTWGENIAWSGQSFGLDLSAQIDIHHRGLFLSDGHRKNLLNGSFREIGLGQVGGDFTSGATTWDASMLTEKFAASGPGFFITGVTYSDRNANGQYSIGEGVSGVIAAIAGGQSTTTSEAGGYALSAGSGVARVALGAALVDVEVQGVNIKIDLSGSGQVASSASLALVSGVQHAILLGVGSLSLTGASGSERLTGNKGDNRVIAMGGDDLIAGGAGNDTLDGGTGTDTAIFSGVRTGYTITRGPGQTTVTGADGTDILSNIELLQFSDLTISIANNLPTGVVSVLGTPTRGQTLLASNTLADIDGLGAISYQWKAAGINIAGATASSYTLTAAEVGKAIAVVASYTDGFGTAESVTSVATAPVGDTQLNIQGMAYYWKSHMLLGQVNVQVSGQTSTSTPGTFELQGLTSTPVALLASRSAGDSGSAITSADALAALRIATGVNPNPDPDGAGPLTALKLSPYQLMAADVNKDGKVTSADALAILRMATNHTSAPAKEWYFVKETQDLWNEATNSSALTRTAASWSNGLGSVELSPSGNTLNVVGVLKGDVNGSWAAPAGSIDLDNTNPSYFQLLGAQLAQPTDVWGV